MACKVDAYGAAYHHPCGNTHCGKVEIDPVNDPFNMCGKCKLTAFCSQACLKTGWAASHKQLCGTTEAEAHLPSAVAAKQVVDSMMSMPLEMAAMGIPDFL